jgi:hypothetical protein
MPSLGGCSGERVEKMGATPMLAAVASAGVYKALGWMVRRTLFLIGIRSMCCKKHSYMSMLDKG